jgi:Sodium/calcium exchanger protein
VIARVLGLSENLAGVTVLAFGNGSPDIFTSLAGAPRGRSELIFGELFGSGLFVTTVIAGAIITIRPFQVLKRFLTFKFFSNKVFVLGDGLAFFAGRDFLHWRRLLDVLHFLQGRRHHLGSNWLVKKSIRKCIFILPNFRFYCSLRGLHHAVVLAERVAKIPETQLSEFDNDIFRLC